MNILFLAPRLPWPTDTGGKIRTFNLLKQIAKTHQVTLASFSFEDNDADFVKYFKLLISMFTLFQPKKKLYSKKPLLS